MNKLTDEKCKTLIERLSEDKRASRISIFGELYLQALEIALPVLERQSGWVSCGYRMPEREGHYLVFAEASNLEGYCDHNDIAAYQGGEWSNEFGWLVTHWQPLPEFPQKESTTDTRRQIENDSWIEWKGGIRPIGFLDDVEIRLRSGNEINGNSAGHWSWQHTGGIADIIAYRVIENDGREG